MTTSEDFWDRVQDMVWIRQRDGAYDVPDWTVIEGDCLEVMAGTEG